MRRLIASEFVTLDGVMEAPGHEPHPDGRNAWALRHAGEDQQRFKADEVFQAGAILLGRVTYEIFAAFWPTAPRDEGFADRMNDLPKYVVSKTLESPSWRNSTVIRGDAIEAITDLKAEHGGDIFLYGSCHLLNAHRGRLDRRVPDLHPRQQSTQQDRGKPDAAKAHNQRARDGISLR